MPVATKRCVVKLDGAKAEKKTARWQQIAESAAKQSKRMLVPEAHSVMKFKDALALAKELDVCLVPYELAKGMKETKAIIESTSCRDSPLEFLSGRRAAEEDRNTAGNGGRRKAGYTGTQNFKNGDGGTCHSSVLMFHLKEIKSDGKHILIIPPQQSVMRRYGKLCAKL